MASEFMMDNITVLSNSSNSCRYSMEHYMNENVPLKIVLVYFVPCFVLIGLIGNALTLITLNASVNKQTTKTNLFLSAKVLADLCLGIFALLLNLNTYNGASYNDLYNRFYYHHLQKPLLAFMNCLLMSSTW